MAESPTGCIANQHIQNCAIVIIKQQQHPTKLLFCMWFKINTSHIISFYVLHITRSFLKLFWLIKQFQHFALKYPSPSYENSSLDFILCQFSSKNRFVKKYVTKKVFNFIIGPITQAIKCPTWKCIICETQPIIYKILALIVSLQRRRLNEFNVNKLLR